MPKLKIILLLCYHVTVITVFGDIQGTSLNATHFCEISNSNFSVVYNFTKLIRPLEDVTVNHEYPIETFRIQLCSPLKKSCNGKDGYGICLIKNKEEKGIGKMPPKIMNEPGKVLFVFTGDKCTDDANYTVSIIMKCDYLATDYTYPDIFPHAEQQCNLNMIWRTSLACRSETQTDCTVENNGLHYDLSPLKRYTENYIVSTGDTKRSKIILNVCHSVIFEYGALCPTKSGACLQTINDKSEYRYTNLGDVHSKPFMENQQLKIVYDYGAICKETAAPHIKTTITFLCDLKAVDTFPEYVRGSEECDYQLIWKTAAACSVETLRNQSAMTATTCSITNPLSNFVYNLQSLMDKDFYATAKSGNKYTFSVCSPLRSTLCQPGSGVCYTLNGTAMGKANTKLMWQEGGPYLNYTDGNICENGQPHFTIIGFICGAEGSSSQPIVMEEHPCQLIINWNTDLVCEKRLKCATDDDEINLSSLIRSDTNYVVKKDDIEFQINICRPLVPVQGFTCSHGSAACKALLTSTNEYVNETSLGFPLENPLLREESLVVLRYLGGSPCTEDSRKMVATNIRFPCSYTRKGALEYKKYESCTFIFEWETSLTCKTAVGNWLPPCSIRDQQSYEYDLSLLHRNTSVYHVRSTQGKEYNINICPSEKYCKGSAICLGNTGYGSLGSVIFHYNRNTIKLEYSSGNKCGNRTYTSEVQLICNEHAGIGAPKLLWESQCSVEFEWHTNITCALAARYPGSADSENGPMQHFSPSHAGAIACAVLIVIVLVGIALYFRDPNKGARLRSCFSTFTSKRNTGRVQYCRVNTTEEAWLLLDADPTQCQTDSDDDLLNA